MLFIINNILNILKCIQFIFFMLYMACAIILSNIVNVLLPDPIFQYIFYWLIIGCNACMNNKVFIYGNLENLKQQGCIYVSNHYDGIDGLLILQLITYPGFNSTYTIGKSDVVLPHKYGIIANLVNNLGVRSSNLIPYHRGNKESGALVLQNVKDKFKQKKHMNLLLFPEGQSCKYGISTNFKPGIFRFAEENHIPIIPITICYKPYIAQNKGEKGNMFLWLNNDAHFFIHEKIEPQDYQVMLQKSFDMITSTHKVLMDEINLKIKN